MISLSDFNSKRFPKSQYSESAPDHISLFPFNDLTSPVQSMMGRERVDFYATVGNVELIYLQGAVRRTITLS